MSVYSIKLLLGVLLMAQVEGTITVDPGKQLPQAIKLQVTNDDGSTSEFEQRYLLFTPKDYKSDGEPWPLMLFLHGYGECSDTDLDRVKIHGPPKLVDSRPDFPFVVVSPQHAMLERDFSKIVKAWRPEELVQLVDHVVKELNIDTRRVYVTGLSMGGYGTWRLAAAHPERFAAAVPICGGGEPEQMAEGLRGVPVWAFHGAKDEIVPLSASEEMVDAVRKAGGEVRLTVYPEAGHNSWVQAYDNQEVYDWLLSHRRPE